MKRGWLIWTLFAVVSWGVWAVLGRFIGEGLSPAQGQALSTIGLVPVMLALWFSGKAKGGSRTKRGVTLAFMAGVLVCLGNIAYYYVLNSGAKAVTVVPLTALYPLVTVVLGLIFLRERLNTIQKFGVALSITAIYLFNIQTTSGVLSAWLLAAMGPVLLWGLSGFVQKLSTNDVSGELSALWFLAAFVPVSILILVWEPLPARIPGKVLMVSGFLGLTLAVGNFAILQAYSREGKASVIAPLGGLYPVVSIPIAVLAFKEQIGWREMFGIIFSCGAIAALAMEGKRTS